MALTDTASFNIFLGNYDRYLELWLCVEIILLPLSSSAVRADMAFIERTCKPPASGWLVVLPRQWWNMLIMLLAMVHDNLPIISLTGIFPAVSGHISYPGGTGIILATSAFLFGESSEPLIHRRSK